VGRIFLKFVAPLAVGAAALTFAGAPTAGALAPRATDASFVGTYKVKLEVPGDKYRPAGELILNADGTSPAGPGKKVAHWSNDGTKLTITLTIKKHTEVLTAVQTKTDGLGTKKAPGTISVDGVDSGISWVAVKTS
jgi:hypothetical protein